ncbi:MAG TPA: hypothetical protein VHJ20_08305 [Polyangia bacterium]|nr:hypothetical protein [Polyangia bacterium]
MRRVFVLALTLAACGRAPLDDGAPVCVDDRGATEPLYAPPCLSFTRDTAFDMLAGTAFTSSPRLSAVGTGPADFDVALQSDFAGRIAHWNGAAWTIETLPDDPYMIDLLAIDESGEPWALVAERGNSKSGVGGPTALLHRRAGRWVVEPVPPKGNLGALGGARSGFFSSTFEPASGVMHLWSWFDEGWHEMPTALSPAEMAANVSFSTTGFWGGSRCGQALAFGGGSTMNSLFGTAFRLDGGGWTAVPVPVLSDILSVSGPSSNAVFVLALDRNENGDPQFFQLTNGFTTWTPVRSDREVDYTSVWSADGAHALAIGCRRPDPTNPTQSGCATATTLESDRSSTMPLAVEGTPASLWVDPQTHELHLFTNIADANGLLRGAHYVAPATCP